jgi:hypothetical protein
MKTEQQKYIGIDKKKSVFFNPENISKHILVSPLTTVIEHASSHNAL